jgi:hypothetical protein
MDDPIFHESVDWDESVLGAAYANMTDKFHVFIFSNFIEQATGPEREKICPDLETIFFWAASDPNSDDCCPEIQCQ